MAYVRARPAGTWRDWPDTSTPASAAMYEQWDQAIYDLKTLLTNTQQLTSPTYGAAASFGNVPGSFTFAGTPPGNTDIYAPIVIYQRYNFSAQNTDVTHTTQGLFGATIYYGRTVDDSAEGISWYTAIKDTGTPITQAKPVTSAEFIVGIEGGNNVTGSHTVGVASRTNVGTGTVDEVNNFYIGAQQNAGVITNWYGIRQASAVPGTVGNKWFAYGIDQIQTEAALKVGRSANSGVFAADWSFANGNAFVYAQLPDGTDHEVVRIQAITGQTQHLQGWWDSSSNERAFVSATGNIFVNGSSFVAQLSGANQIIVGSTGLQWAAAGLTQTTVGAAGGASALPASPTKYLKILDPSGSTLVIPAYAAA